MAYAGYLGQRQNDPARRPNYSSRSPTKAYAGVSGGFLAQRQIDPFGRPNYSPRSPTKAYAGGFGGNFAQWKNDPARRPNYSSRSPTKAYAGVSGGYLGQRQNDPARWPNYSSRTPTKAYAGLSGGYLAQWQNDPARRPNYSSRSPTKAYAGVSGGYLAQRQNDPARPNPIVVIDPKFCESYPVDLVVCKKVIGFVESPLTITDVKGNVLFKVKGSGHSFDDRRVLLDAYDDPIISFPQKGSIVPQWQAFRGNSLYLKDLLFSVKKLSMLQYNSHLDVSLAANTTCVHDFKIKGKWFEKSFTFYAPDGNTIIAQMHKKQSALSTYDGKETFGITVYPDVDYAFIVALVVILNEIKGYY